MLKAKRDETREGVMEGVMVLSAVFFCQFGEERIERSSGIGGADEGGAKEESDPRRRRRCWGVCSRGEAAITEAAAVREEGRERAADEITPFMNGR